MEGTTEIDLSTLWDIVIPLAVAILTALAGWLSVRITSYFKLKSDDVVRGYLDEILKRGIALGQLQLQEVAARYSKVDVRNALIASAANYALRQAPDAVTRFGLTPSQVEAMVEARLGGKALPGQIAANDNAVNDNPASAGQPAAEDDILAPRKGN